MKVITNHKPRQLFAFTDLPAKDQDDFSYVAGDEQHDNRFVRFQASWYDVFDVPAIRVYKETIGAILGQYVVAEDSPLAEWDAIMNDSYFSATVFKLTKDHTVVCGRVYS